MSHRSAPASTHLLACSATALLFAALLAPACSAAQTVAGCSFEWTDGAGPFDYRSQRQMLAVVERRHFTPRVERLIGGQSTKHPGPDIDYTLAKFPNHHRALLALSRLSQKLRTPAVPQMRYPVDCYFERALRFRADDTVARLSYALHLSHTGRKAEATAQLELASKHAQDNPISHVNIGLLALEVNDPARALRHAYRAHALGLEANELRAALAKAGQWRDPEPTATDPASTTEAPVAASAASAASAP